MKTNFKYVFLMAAALVLGFSSCSSDDADNNQPVEGQKTVVKVSLTQNLATTYGPGSPVAPEENERVINSAVLYVFNALKVLEAEVALEVRGTGTSSTTADKVFELTTGTKYFYAAVNVPSDLKRTISVGTAMDVAIKSLVGVTDVSDLYPAATGYFMTNVTTAEAVAIGDATQAEATAGPKNNVTIPVGRAMIKASVDYTFANVTQPITGELINVKFLLANNPVKMHYMAYLNSTGQLETPFFNAATPITTANYYPVLNGTTNGLTFIDADGATTTYGMENSNSVPREGTATFALIQGKFVPAVVVDKDGVSASLSASGNFWCIRHNGSLTGKFYSEDPTGGTDIAVLAGAEVVAYADGLCYYAFYLADDSVTGNATLKYTVKRNCFWKMAITSVSGVGSNTPGGVITNPDTPIEESTYIKGTIDVLNWSVYGQSGGI